MTRRQTGKRGETIAATALQRAGYTILDRNWRCAMGELDLIARHRGDIVFVEVRARQDGADVALESISRRKSAKLAVLAQAYLDAHGIEDAAYRIDVVAINLAEPSPTVEIIENAVGW
jgi:putative endonuclease